MIQAIPRWLLIFLLFFNAAGAYYGGALLMASPSGDRLHMTTDQLQDSPFHDFFIPGLILLLFNGVLPTVAGIGMLRQRPRRPLPGFPLLKKRHWAWSLALISGLGLVIWIGVQIAMLGYWKDFPIQAVYGILGLLITGLALLPVVQAHYKIQP